MVIRRLRLMWITLSSAQTDRPETLVFTGQSLIVDLKRLDTIKATLPPQWAKKNDCACFRPWIPCLREKAFCQSQ